MMNYSWKDNNNNTYYYYKVINGLVCGQVHQITHTQTWMTKVWENPSEEQTLGIFISIEHAKAAVQQYYDMQERTLLENGNV